MQVIHRIRDVTRDCRSYKSRTEDSPRRVNEFPLRCSGCGMPIANGQVGPCPNCGGAVINQPLIDTANNYSGTIAVSGSNRSALGALGYTRNMLASIVSSDPSRARFVGPIIIELEKAAKIVQQQETELARAKKEDWNEYIKRIDEYRKMIEKGLEEPEFQAFFEKNAIFLDPKTTTKVYSKFRLADELIPDFLLVLHDSSYLFVEIEKPSVRLFDKKGKQTAPFSQAQQQIRDQLKWVDDNKVFLRDRECPSLTGDNFKGLLVIGRSADLSTRETAKLENINAELRGRYEIKTFDKILSENETMVNNIKKYKK